MQALLQLPAPLPPSQSSPQDLLLTALSVCGSGTAAVLAGGIIKLFERQLGAKSTTAPASAAPRSHPLYRALLSNPAAAQPLVLGAARLLTEAAEQEPAASFSRCLAALRPFLSCVLLDPQLSAAQLLLPLQLHSALARVACTCSSGAAQLELLRLLAAHLPAMLLAPGDGGGSATLGPQLAAAAAAAVAEVVEVVESCTEEPGGRALHGDAALACVLSARRVLASAWPIGKR